MYGNVEEAQRILRKYTDLDSSLLTNFLNEATIQVIELISTPIIGELVSYNSNLNRVKVANQYIADINGDKTIDSNDVLVQYMDSNNQLHSITVSSVDSELGYIYISDSIPTGVKVFATYRYYSKKPDWNEIDRLATLIAVEKYILSEILLLPDRWKAGGFSYSIDKSNILKILEKEIHTILSKYVSGGVADIDFSYERKDNYKVEK